jgi:hypothetical protein
MKRAVLVGFGLLCAATALADVRPPDEDETTRAIRAAASRAAVPAENSPSLREAPPMPPVGNLDEKMRTIFTAVREGRPELAMNGFFPREPFLRVKAIANPERYWNVLLRAYERDIRELHASIPNVAQAEFVRFEFSRRRTWQTVRSEANALPYWCVRHSRIVYRSGGREQSFEVRALIHWGREWFVTHLK